jgi:hypothetical protein
MEGMLLVEEHLPLTVVEIHFTRHIEDPRWRLKALGEVKHS